MWDTSRREVMDWLLQPFSIEAFASEYYERRPLYVERSDAGYYDGHASLTDVEALLFGVELEKGDLRITKDGADVRPEEWLHVLESYNNVTKKITTREIVDPHKAVQLFASGCTLFFERAGRHCPAVAAMQYRLESFFGHAIDAGIFLTPAGAQGLAVHYDSIDAIVLHCEGRKRWRVYEPCIELPLDEAPRNQKDKPGALLLDVEMRPGDMLYMPRGTFHEPRANDASYSLHVTYGLRPVKWHHVLREALQDAARANPLLRASACAPTSEESIAAIVGQTFALANLRRIEQRLDDRNRETIRNPGNGVLQQAVSLDDLTPSSTVRLRPGAIYSIKSNGSGCVLTCSGVRIPLPEQAQTAVSFLERCGSAAIEDLPLEPSRAVGIVRKLIAAAVLEQPGLRARSVENAVFAGAGE